MPRLKKSLGRDTLGMPYQRDSEVELEIDEPVPSCKLDLQYFTTPGLCPLMVRQRARKAFELFLYLAHRCL